MTRTVRLYKLLELVSSDETLTAAALAAELGCSERTIYRDLQDLSSELNAPVHFDNGYKLTYRVRLTPIHFTPEEAIALRLALGATPLRKTEPISLHTVSALKKIEAAMSESSYRASRQVASKVSLGGDHYESVGLSPATLALIEQAVLQQRQVAMTYKSLESSAPKARVVDPYGLAYRKHTWYTIGYCHIRRNVVQFKISRIRQARLLETSFEPPADFSVDAFYGPSWEVVTGDPVKVEVLFDANLKQLVTESRRHPSQQTRELPDGRIHYTAEVAGYVEFGWWVLSFGGGAEVVSPPDFREWAADHARRSAAHYEG